MELPPFEFLWQTSEKLSELESILSELDGLSTFQTLQPRKRYRKYQGDGLFGVTFEVEDPTYYEPYKRCCDESFYTQFAYDRHIESHIKCEIDGCSFVGCKRLLKFHAEMMHTSGFFDKIYRPTSDRAVIEWREARKRNYPTLEKAAVKQELLVRQIAHGQIFATPKHSSLKRRQLPVVSAKVPRAVPSSSESIHVENGALTQNTPTSLPHENDPIHRLSNAVSPDVSTEDTSVMKTQPSCSLVACDYDSDSSVPADEKSQDQCTADSTLIDQISQSATQSEASNDCKRLRGRRRRGGRGRRARQAKKIEKPDETDTQQTSDAEPSADESPQVTDKSVQSNDPFASHPLVRMQARRRVLSKEPNRIYSRPTLLHMLLAEEMRVERNHLMQCIRFVIKNNFFMDPTEKEDKK